MGQPARQHGGFQMRHDPILPQNLPEKPEAGFLGGRGDVLVCFLVAMYGFLADAYCHSGSMPFNQFIGMTSLLSDLLILSSDLLGDFHEVTF